MSDTAPSISFVIYIGIIIFIIPVLSQIVGIQLPGWISKIGLAGIAVGVGHTVWLRRK